MPVLLRWLLAAAAAFVLYFFQLTAVGILGPDEARYAWIAREMAQSGDWITPRLYGEPWFEKPPLLYWLGAVGFKLGLGDDWAPRLPVALLSVAALAVIAVSLRREFGDTVARNATLILATSAGWLSLSHVAVTDLPMAACFATAMVLSLEWLKGGSGRWLPAVAALLGGAVLAKGLVPLVLALPLVWFGRARWREALAPRVWGAFLVAAAPWYAVCSARNGWPFVEELFIRHHLSRFTSPDLQHVQPWWFYLPVILASLFPWTPLLSHLPSFSDVRIRFTAAWLVWGLVFLSASRNKLSTYVLPLVPALAILAAAGFDRARERRWTLSVAVALLCVAGPLATILGPAIVSGLTRSTLPPFSAWWLLPLVAIPLLWRVRDPLPWAAVAVIAAVVWLKVDGLPKVDAAASARSMAKDKPPCVLPMPRGLRYSLAYYVHENLPECP